MARKSYVLLISLLMMSYISQVRTLEIVDQEIREIQVPSIARQPGINETTTEVTTDITGTPPAATTAVVVPLTTEFNVTLTTESVAVTTDGSPPLTTESSPISTTSGVSTDTSGVVTSSSSLTSSSSSGVVSGSDGASSSTSGGKNESSPSLVRPEATMLIVFLRVYLYPVVSFFIVVLTAASVYRRQRPLLRSPLALVPFTLCGLVLLFYWMLIMIGVGEDARSDWIVYMFLSELYIFVLFKEIYHRCLVPVFRAPSSVASNTVELTVTLTRDPAGAQEQGGWDVSDSEWV